MGCVVEVFSPKQCILNRFFFTLRATGLENLNMSKCDQLERCKINYYSLPPLFGLMLVFFYYTIRRLKGALEAVEMRKTTILREELDTQKEQRLCVVCQAAERTIVLLPCRHLCLCSDCAEHDSLKDCPLCRKEIQHKFNVFS